MDRTWPTVYRAALSMAQWATCTGALSGRLLFPTLPALAVFVHALGPDGQLVGQQDGPPRNGAYPTTWWLPGEIVVDRLATGVPIPPGVSLVVGMYDPATVVRLPAYDATGQRMPNDAVRPAVTPVHEE